MDQKEQILSTIHQMVDAFHKGDIAGILKTYEPGAVVMAQPGAAVSGRAAEPAFAREGTSFADARALIQRIEDTQRVLELHRTALPVRSAAGVAELVIAAIDAVAPTHAYEPDLAGRRH